MPVPPVCPASFDEARFGAFETLGDDSFIATGTVIRFVNAPDPEFRGYDVAVARHDGPVFVDGIVFLRAEEPYAGIATGQPVLVLGERTDRRNLILPGTCPPLQPIEDAGRPGGAGSDTPSVEAAIGFRYTPPATGDPPRAARIRG